MHSSQRKNQSLLHDRNHIPSRTGSPFETLDDTNPLTNTTLLSSSHHPGANSYPEIILNVMICRYPLYIEERHHALGRDATFPWSRVLTHPRGDTECVTGSSEVMTLNWAWTRSWRHDGHLGAAILACDVIYSISTPILLSCLIPLLFINKVIDLPHPKMLLVH